MRSALVHAFDKPPTVGTFAAPVPSADQVLVTVKAVGIAPIVRLAASGAFYSAAMGAAKFPFIPGVDGVGHLADNPSSRVYFAFPTAPHGSLADTVAIPRANIAPIPEGLSDVEAAALANPLVASWKALTRRTQLKRGETVLINGATGMAGRLAVQVAKQLGAGRIITTGRNKQKLDDTRALGATETILLDGNKEDTAARFKAAIQTQGGVDVILDYLWGSSAEQLIAACMNAGSRTSQARSIRYINIGAISAPTITIPAVPLRSSRLEIMGAGVGSEPDSEVAKSVGEALQVAKEAGFKVEIWTAPIEEIEKAWTTEVGDKDSRLVITL